MGGNLPEQALIAIGLHQQNANDDEDVVQQESAEDEAAAIAEEPGTHGLQELCNAIDRGNVEHGRLNKADAPPFAELDWGDVDPPGHSGEPHGKSGDAPAIPESTASRRATSSDRQPRTERGSTVSPVIVSPDRAGIVAPSAVA